MRKTVLVVGCLALTGCASGADKVFPTYVSPMKYQDSTCPELRAEAVRISQQMAVATGQQNARAVADNAAFAASMIVFWPAAILIRGDGPAAAEVARLKGEKNAISDANFDKKCGIVWQG